MIRSRSHLRYRKDLDATVLISPDEAGIFDLALKDADNVRLRDELDLIMATGVNAEHDVLEASYTAGPNLYYAEVIGQPPDGIVSRWIIRFEIQS